MDNISGDFVSSTAKVGALRVWNAAHESPKEMIKVGPHGISAIFPVYGKFSLFLLQFKNG
jgi:hypothetical protein